MKREYPKDLKPMRYAESYMTPLPFEILYEGEYRGVKFRITNNRGYNPCCYIRVPDDLLYNELLCGDEMDTYYQNIFNVHGGITYTGNFDTWHEGEINCVGWDYAHLGDYTPGVGGYGFEPDHRWTAEELYDECIEAIDNILENKF